MHWGAHGGPIQDGGRADTSAPIGSVSLRGIYVYYVYVTNPVVSSGLSHYQHNLHTVRNIHMGQYGKLFPILRSSVM